MVPIFRSCFRSQDNEVDEDGLPLVYNSALINSYWGTRACKIGFGLRLVVALPADSGARFGSSTFNKSTLDDVSDLGLMTILSSLTCRFREPESFEKPRVFSSILNLEQNFGAEFWKS